MKKYRVELTIEQLIAIECALLAAARECERRAEDNQRHQLGRLATHRRKEAVGLMRLHTTLRAAVDAAQPVEVA